MSNKEIPYIIIENGVLNKKCQAYKNYNTLSSIKNLDLYNINNFLNNLTKIQRELLEFYSYLYKEKKSPKILNCRHNQSCRSVQYFTQKAKSSVSKLVAFKITNQKVAPNIIRLYIKTLFIIKYYDFNEFLTFKKNNKNKDMLKNEFNDIIEKMIKYGIIQENNIDLINKIKYTNISQFSQNNKNLNPENNEYNQILNHKLTNNQQNPENNNSRYYPNNIKIPQNNKQQLLNELFELRKDLYKNWKTYSKVNNKSSSGLCSRSSFTSKKYMCRPQRFSFKKESASSINKTKFNQEFQNANINVIKKQINVLKINLKNLENLQKSVTEQSAGKKQTPLQKLKLKHKNQINNLKNKQKNNILKLKIKHQKEIKKLCN